MSGRRTASDAYGKRLIESHGNACSPQRQPRNVFADETGGRRFWRWSVSAAIDVDGLAECRTTWAEATALYFDGKPWWLTR